MCERSLRVEQGLRLFLGSKARGVADCRTPSNFFFWVTRNLIMENEPVVGAFSWISLSRDCGGLVEARTAEQNAVKALSW